MTPNVETDELQSIRFLPEGFSFRFARKSVQSRCQARRSLPTSRLPVTNRGKRVSDYFRAGTTVYLELWSSFPTTPFMVRG